MKKRILALCLALVLCLGLLPLTALGAELPKLPTPSNLKWGIRYIDNSGTWEAVPGYASWKTNNKNSHAEYRIDYYNISNELVRTMWPEQRSSLSWMSDMGFRDDAAWMEDGTYYFTVQALGDGVNNADSEIAKSDTWELKCPDKSLDIPSAPTWDWPYAVFHVPASPYFDQVYYNVWFSDTKTNATLTNELVWIGGAWLDADQGKEDLTDLVLRQSRPGYYYVEFRTLSNNITECQNSEYSSLSAAFYYEGKSETPSSPKPSESAQPSQTPTESPKPSESPSTSAGMHSGGKEFAKLSQEEIITLLKENPATRER